MRAVSGPGFATLGTFVVQIVSAQTAPRDTASGWNSEPALQLIERARVRRQQPLGDTALRSYSAKATGHVYFYLDRQDTTENTLVKVDQIALELFWAAPNRTKQRIVGLRDVSRLPNRMRYHLDHLTVVQNGFGDVIRLGDGDEVSDVPHPAAPGSDSVYDFRLADSLSLTFPPQPPVRVYEVQVRPRQFDRSALVGSIFIDQASADIVRMTFTFTPASYVDRRLDYINISLDNGLWNGNYWLPNEQYVEIRRQIPELDFVAGAVIKGRLRVYGYDFNHPFPRDFFFGPSVEALPEEERKSFDFEEEIYAGLDREGLAPPPQVEALRAQALALMRQRKLSGLPGVRLHIPNASSVLRHNRTEGWYVGAGLAYVPGGALRLESTFGLATRNDRPALSVAARAERPDGALVGVRAYLHEHRDLGYRAPLPEALNTVSSAVDDRDYLDIYFVSGAQASVGLLRNAVTFAAGVERHDAVNVEAREEADPALPTWVQSGTLIFARASTQFPLRSWERGQLGVDVSLENGYFAQPGSTTPVPRDTLDGLYLRSNAAVTATHQSADRQTDVMLRASAGHATGTMPFQKAFVLGGLNTLPASEHRRMIGLRFALLEGEVARDVWAPWLRVRLRGAAAVAGGDHADRVWPQALYTRAASAGVGVGLFWDILRLDVYHGRLGTRAYFSVTPSLWDTM